MNVINDEICCFPNRIWLRSSDKQQQQQKQPPPVFPAETTQNGFYLIRSATIRFNPKQLIWKQQIVSLTKQNQKKATCLLLSFSPPPDGKVDWNF